MSHDNLPVSKDPEMVVRFRLYTTTKVPLSSPPIVTNLYKIKTEDMKAERLQQHASHWFKENIESASHAVRCPFSLTLVAFSLSDDYDKENDVLLVTYNCCAHVHMTALVFQASRLSS